MATTALVRRPFSAAPGLADIVDEVAALAPGRMLVDPQLVAAAARAWSANTVRAFLSDLKIWDGWCRSRRIATATAMADDVAGYVRALSVVACNDDRLELQ